ncbi:hypothetical protein [Caenimonas soli]|uniref:hypothetical protein n=1 Tax=Caenimonas soli TaxID=2735555 RepID=UPI001552DA23|nr:hypothetical protein [Caenimonas soli]NPC57841.1 hypothetical protein [Caenimonas soli]
MAEEEKKLGPPRVAIECRFDGGRVEASGTRLTLPLEHERNRFLASAEVANFLAAVRLSPKERHRAKLTDYSITLLSRPRSSDADTFISSSGPVLESPQTVAEHAAFRALRAKIEQHKVDEPYIVCIGSDVSRVLTDGLSGFYVRLQQALGAAVRPSGRLSAVLVVSIKTQSFLPDTSRHAQGTLYPVAGCRHPLLSEEIQALETMNLNRWKYTFPLARRESPPKHRRTKVGGPLTTTYTRSHAVKKLTIPASVLVDILAGRTSLSGVYGSGDQDVINSLRQGWTVVGCKFKNGNIEQAQSGTVELELSPPHEAVFWGKDATGTS